MQCRPPAFGIDPADRSPMFIPCCEAGFVDFAPASRHDLHTAELASLELVGSRSEGVTVCPSSRTLVKALPCSVACLTLDVATASLLAPCVGELLSDRRIT